MPADRNIEKKKVQLYATSVLESAAGDRGKIFDFDAALRELVRAYYNDSELGSAFTNGRLDEQQRHTLAQNVFASLPDGVREVVIVMAEQGDMYLVSRISEQYTLLAEEALGAVVVSVVTAVELDDHLRDVIKRKLAGDFGTDVVLLEHVDPKIVGGIIMSAHGQRIDASIASHLENARMTLSSSPIGGEEQ